MKPSYHPPDIPGQLAVAAGILAAASDTPRLDAELLLAHALGISRTALLLDPRRHEVPDHYANLVARRLGHEPVAYIVGRQAFWTIEIEVGPGVLIPRSDSELLIALAVKHFGVDGPASILDLGTGPGTLLLAALSQWPEARGVGVDMSATALMYARDNAEMLGLSDRVTLIDGGWGEGAAADLVLCNPPYVEAGAVLDPQVAEHEPAEALFAGPDGLDAYRALLPLLPDHILPGGIAIVEIGAAQAEAVMSLARGAGLSGTVHQDLAGRDRALLLSHA